MFAASKTAYPIHFVKTTYLQLQKSANPYATFWKRSFSLARWRCGANLNTVAIRRTKPPKNSGQNFKVNNCITVRFGKNEITMNQKNYKKKPPRRMLNPKCPKRKKSLSTLYRFYLLISAFYGFWVTLTGPAVYNGI